MMTDKILTSLMHSKPEQQEFEYMKILFFWHWRTVSSKGTKNVQIDVIIVTDVGFSIHYK